MEKQLKNKMYAKGFKEGWDKAVEVIEERICKDDVYNSHVAFAWNKVKEVLYSDDMKGVKDAN